MAQSTAIFRCSSPKERDAVYALLAKSTALSHKVHEMVLGHPVEMSEGEVLMNALKDHTNQLHGTIRLLQRKVG